MSSSVADPLTRHRQPVTTATSAAPQTPAVTTGDDVLRRVVAALSASEAELLVQTLGRLDADLDVATALCADAGLDATTTIRFLTAHGADPAELRTAMARPVVDRFGDPAPLFADVEGLRGRCAARSCCSRPAPNPPPQASTGERYDPVSRRVAQLRRVDHGDGNRQLIREVSADEDPGGLAAVADALALDYTQAVAAWADAGVNPSLAAAAALRRRNGNIELACRRPGRWMGRADRLGRPARARAGGEPGADDPRQLGHPHRVADRCRHGAAVTGNDPDDLLDALDRFAAATSARRVDASSGLVEAIDDWVSEHAAEHHRSEPFSTVELCPATGSPPGSLTSSPLYAP